MQVVIVRVHSIQNWTSLLSIFRQGLVPIRSLFNSSPSKKTTGSREIALLGQLAKRLEFLLLLVYEQLYIRWDLLFFHESLEDLGVSREVLRFRP